MSYIGYCMYKAAIRARIARSVADCEGPDGLGIESQCEQDFLHQFRLALGLTQSPVQRVLGIFPGVIAARVWQLPTSPSSAKVQERVELYLYSPSGSAWPVIGQTLPFNFMRLVSLQPTVCCMYYIILEVFPN